MPKQQELSQGSWPPILIDPWIAKFPRSNSRPILRTKQIHEIGPDLLHSRLQISKPWSQKGKNIPCYEYHKRLGNRTVVLDGRDGYCKANSTSASETYYFTCDCVYLRRETRWRRISLTTPERRERARPTVRPARSRLGRPWFGRLWPGVEARAGRRQTKKRRWP